MAHNRAIIFHRFYLWLELTLGIEPRIQSYQDCGMPFTYVSIGAGWENQIPVTALQGQGNITIRNQQILYTIYHIMPECQGRVQFFKLKTSLSKYIRAIFKDI